MPTLLSVPVRRFSWRSRQRHRPGLEFLVSTGRLHGFESLEERSLLLALDFVGTVVEVLAQPFRLRFETTGEGFREQPWRRIWHLPVVFACPTHRRLTQVDDQRSPTPSVTMAYAVDECHSARR